MKLTALEDIAAPIDTVFAAVTDVEALERAALRRGFDVLRRDTGGPVGAGAAWDVTFDFRGRARTARTTITEWTPPQGASFVAEAEGIEGRGEIDLTRLAKARTRLVITVDIEPLTFRARLLLQSLKLARSGLDAQFRDRIGAYARQIEARGA